MNRRHFLYKHFFVPTFCELGRGGNTMKICKLTHGARASARPCRARGHECGAVSARAESRRGSPFSVCAIESLRRAGGGALGTDAGGMQRGPSIRLLGRGRGAGCGEALKGPLPVGRKELAGDEKEEGGRCPSLNLGKQQAR